jgi:signal transduction histidine kinase
MGGRIFAHRANRVKGALHGARIRENVRRMAPVEVGSGQSGGPSAAVLDVPPAGAVVGDSLAHSLEVVGRRVSVTAAVLAILALASVSVVLAATSDHVEHPTAAALYYGYLVAASLLVGLYWYLRRPSSTFGLLLGSFGLTTWVVSWQSSDWPLAFDIGVLAEGVFFVLTFYLFLAFPTGRLQTRGNRLLIAFMIVAALAFFVPWALLTPVIAGGGPLAGCAPACPAYVLQVASSPAAVEFLGRWETYCMLAVVIAVLGVYWRRVMTASRPQRRALIAVAASSLLFLPIFFIYHFSSAILEADPATLEPMAWALVGIRVILPLGFLVALFQAELFAGAIRGRLLEQLLRRPSPQQWREAIAIALDDPPVRIAFWDPAAERYREADGTDLEPPEPDSGRSTVEASRNGQPVAAMVIDDALAEDPELVRAATSATLLAVENGNLEGELRASQNRIREVGAAERKRIESNLHDSAQQRLIALRINLELTSERMQGPERLEIQRFGEELDHALEEVRAASSGALPPALLHDGVATALRSLAGSAAMAVEVEDRGFGRRSELVETTAFYCCAEALQNATKHAGPGASATVQLSQSGPWVHFSVEDDGAGFDPGSVTRGQGLDNMSDRVAAAGGSLAIDSTPGAGTSVVGRLPADA